MSYSYETCPFGSGLVVFFFQNVENVASGN
jgi:hypothetical protein